MFMDTLFVVKELGPSLRGFTCPQLFVTDLGYIKIKPMKLKSKLPLSLKSLFKNTDVPE